MNTTIWILQGLLAAIFLIAGFYKVITPKVKLEKNMLWAKDYTEETIKFIGLSEMLGAFGVILPLALGIYPILTPIAAFALAVIMLLATRIHTHRKEYKEIALNMTIIVIAFLVAIFRFGFINHMN